MAQISPMVSMVGCGICSRYSRYISICFGTHRVCCLSEYYVYTGNESVKCLPPLLRATIGFLWYNSFPAQVFMGDTGSLTLGGIIGVFAVIIHKELLYFSRIWCFCESLSVMIQVFILNIPRKNMEKVAEYSRWLLFIIIFKKQVMPV